jgi:hypothetical protein
MDGQPRVDRFADVGTLPASGPSSGHFECASSCIGRKFTEVRTVKALGACAGSPLLYTVGTGAFIPTSS